MQAHKRAEQWHSCCVHTTSKRIQVEFSQFLDDLQSEKKATQENIMRERIINWFRPLSKCVNGRASVRRGMIPFIVGFFVGAAGAVYSPPFQLTSPLVAC